MDDMITNLAEFVDVYFTVSLLMSIPRQRELRHQKIRMGNWLGMITCACCCCCFCNNGAK